MRVHGNDLPYLLSIDEQVLLLLVRLRLGLQLQFQDLGKRFGISHQLASRIFNSWINILLSFIFEKTARNSISESKIVSRFG